jgi:hypothetical protein
MMVNVEQSVEWELAGETDVLGENLPQHRFVHHKSHKTLPGLEPWPPRWEADDYPPELWHGLQMKYYVDTVVKLVLQTVRHIAYNLLVLLLLRLCYRTSLQLAFCCCQAFKEMF